MVYPDRSSNRHAYKRLIDDPSTFPKMIQSRIDAIRDHGRPLLGQTIERIETAQILLADGTWDDWADLPVRIHCSGGAMISIAWSAFDDLWLSNDESLPFPVDEATTRWRTNRHAKLDAAIGRTIRGLTLGRGEMTIGSRDIEIWTRLLIDLGGNWLEVFNALDESGYAFHIVKPEGEFRPCT